MTDPSASQPPADRHVRAIIETAPRAGKRLALVIDKQRDRYHHRIDAWDGSCSTTLLASMEGDPTQSWPASPPLQERSIEQQADIGQVALLVGMAGASHWSASMHAAADPPRFVFDVACRITAEAEHLASTYLIRDASFVTTDCGGSLQLSSGNVCLKVTVVEGQVTRAADRIFIQPSRQADPVAAGPASRTARPSTVRWKYEFELE